MKNDSIAKTYSKKYKVALFVIGFLSILNFIIIQFLISTEGRFSSLINTAGKQRMLSQRISFLSTTGSNEAELSSLLSQFNQSNNSIYEGHDFSLDNESIRKIQKYYAETDLNKKVNAFINSVNTKSIDPNSDLLQVLDKLVKLIENRSDELTSYLKNFEIFVLLLTLITLVLEAKFIFFPLGNRLNDTFSELKEERDKAIDEKKKKSQFLANISHEMRNPIHGIIGSIDSFDTKNFSQKNMDLLKFLNNTSKSILALVNDLLDFERMENQHFTQSPEWASLQSLCQDLLIIHAKDAMAKNLNFNIKNNAENSHIFVDPIRLKQVLSNFITNAIKYTLEGSIELSINQEETKFEFKISDTGIGLAPDEVDKIFDSFTRIQNEKNKHVDGIGLGLHIAKSIITSLGGAIKVESEENKGSTFTITFNFQTKNLKELSPEKIGDKKDHHKTNFGYNVLVVEDNQVNQQVFKYYLEKLGISFDIAANGQIALNFIKGHDYDIIFSDIRMPVMDGVTFIHLAKNLGLKKETPFVALTANANKADINEYLEFGFERVLAKPLKFDDLYNFINEFQK